MIKQYCVKKSLEIAQQLFPQDYLNRKKYRVYHYSFGFIGRKLVGIGFNRPEMPNAKALYFGKRFGVEQFKEFSYLHSEIDLISRLWGKLHVDGDLAIYSVRLNKFGVQQNSKPCKNCQLILDALGITEIFWSPFTLTLGELK